MQATEFALVIFWVLMPPLILGVALLVTFFRFSGRNGMRRMWSAAILLVVLAIIISLVLLALGPDWLGHYLGIRDIQVSGAKTIWAPFAFISTALAFPFAAWWARGKTKS